MTKIFEDRIDNFRKKLKQNNIEAFLILNGENREYLSGYSAEDTGFEESAGALIISADHLIVATDSRFELQAVGEALLYEVRCYKSSITETIADFLKETGCKKLGFESSRITYSQYCKIKEDINSENIQAEFNPADKLVNNLRVIKSEFEINKIRKTLDIAEKAYLSMISELEPGQTEKATAWNLEKKMRELGADGLSFPPIVASGPNSALPHAISGNRRIKKNEPLLFDWGAKLNSYCSDTSRTVVIGKPDDKFTEVYNILFHAQQMAIEAIMPGVSTKQIDSIARDHIEKNGYGKKFGHGLGHGVGLEIHEPPRVSPLRDIPLEAGMIITIEPGIYLPDWGGIRLENMVLVTHDGASVLNSLSYDDYIIGN